MIPIEYFLTFGAILFVIGAYGVLTKSSTIIVLMCIELMLNAATSTSSRSPHTVPSSMPPSARCSSS